MKREDRWRASGRTTRMLLKAVTKFLEGNDVLVTGWSYKYAMDLIYKVMDILYACGVVAGVERSENVITFMNKKMIFDKHDFDRDKYKAFPSLLHYSDHFYNY